MNSHSFAKTLFMTVCRSTASRPRSIPRGQWLAVGWAALAAGAAIGLMAPGLDDRFQTWPFLASLLVGGMPHGSMDWQVQRRVAGADSFWALVRAFVPYTLHMAGWAVLLAVCPAAGVGAFLVVAAVHFGRADAWFWAGRSSWAQRPWSGRAWRVAVARGALVLATPLAASPAETVGLLNRLIHLVGGDTALPLRLAGPIGATVLLLAVATLAVEAVRCLAMPGGSTGNRAADTVTLLIEPVLLLTALALLHPLFGIGLYFLTWHATRECVRLAASLGMDRGGTITPAAIFRLHLRSLPFWGPSIAVFIGLAAWFAPTGPAIDLALLLIVIFIVATPPHHLLGERDERDRAAGSSAA
jgi:Brp/Blh family beta-carotene 15,15'-monooxygenase